MKKRILAAVLCLCAALTLLPVTAAAEETAENGEQFSLPVSFAEMYEFYLPGYGYTSFAYMGTVNAYKYTSEGVCTEKYAHSLFVSKHLSLSREMESWDELNAKGLIYGKEYESNGVKYILRAPSVGSSSEKPIGKDAAGGLPVGNEWDALVDKGYAKTMNKYSAWGQDAASDGKRAARGNAEVTDKKKWSIRNWSAFDSSKESAYLYYCPVLEITNAEELGANGLQVVTIDMNGGTIGSQDEIKIIVAAGSSFKRPEKLALYRPEGNSDSYFMWLGSDGKLYDRDAEIPAGVTKLTAQWGIPEQFALKPGGTYYFDLTSENMPGKTVAKEWGVLPDTTLHYVPFTYAGTIDAYTLKEQQTATEEYAAENRYPHSLFIAEGNVRYMASWKQLNAEGYIFGIKYSSNGIKYTMRAPSVGSADGSDKWTLRGLPSSNEWDMLLLKNSGRSGYNGYDGYIKKWETIGTWGQDTIVEDGKLRGVVRGNEFLRKWKKTMSCGLVGAVYGYRPVLELPSDLEYDALQVITLQLSDAELGGNSTIQIVVRNGKDYTAPSKNGLTLPGGHEGKVMRWQGSDGVIYKPGDQVPAGVTELTLVWVDGVHEHDYTPWTRYTTIHRRYCKDDTCPYSRAGGHSFTGKHTFSKWEVIRPATATEPGEEKSACDECQYRQTREIPAGAAHEHTYDGWEWDKTHHWHECTDEDCPEKDKGKKDEAEHQFGEWTVTKEATETEKGEKARSCRTEGCEYVDTQEIPAAGDDKPAQPHEHRYDKWYTNPAQHWHLCTDEDCPDPTGSMKDDENHVYVLDDGEVIKEPTETDEGMMEVECTVCGYIREWTIPPVTPHEHTYDGKWSADEVEHWRACADLDCPREDRGEQDRAEHQFGEWTVTREATALEPGEETRACAVCGYSETQATPTMHIHLYPDEWSMDAQQHWKECGDPDCPDRLGSMMSVAQHIFWAEQDESGDTPVYRCSVCGYGKAQGPEEPGGTEGHECEFVYASDAKRHWAECGDENCPDRLESMGDPEAHRFGKWKVTVQPTEETTGWKEQLCEVCEYSKKQEIPVIEPGDPGDDDGPGGDDEPGGGGGRYYYNSSTDGGGENTAPEKVSAPKTADAGVAGYALSGVLGLGGLAFAGRKRRK